MGVEVSGLNSAIRKLTRMDKRMQARIRQEAIVVEARKLAAQARSAGHSFPGAAKYAADTIHERDLPAGAEINAAGGGGLGAQVFKGYEFGARGKRRKTYARRTRGGAAPVTRRTTRQFPPFLGRTGYFYWPTLRSGIKGIRARVETAVNKELNSDG